jgi:hypothetical protein
MMELIHLTINELINYGAFLIEGTRHNIFINVTIRNSILPYFVLIINPHVYGDNFDFKRKNLLKWSKFFNFLL